MSENDFTIQFARDVAHVLNYTFGYRIEAIQDPPETLHVTSKIRFRYVGDYCSYDVAEVEQLEMWWYSGHRQVVLHVVEFGVVSLLIDFMDLIVSIAEHCIEHTSTY